MSSSSASKVVVTQAARTRRSAKGQLKNVPSMTEFMHRRTVVNQYRQFLKCIQRIPDSDYQNSSREEVRQRYRQLASETERR
mmetsp:Transcript_4665/g.7227  ORF Transcript_4665/g.7227 Transcript_4665/m.7227 type:complete len:82 (-) Transcript_4665:59-304(-)